MNDPVFRNVVFLPGTIHAGFPSPASDYEERNLDINDLVVPHPTSSYFMRVSGDSMTGSCIYSDDIIVIDRAITAANNRIVVARIGEEFRSNGFRLYKTGKYFSNRRTRIIRPLKSLHATILKFGVL
jgi:SOS-response transcriptional repressor LexA